MNFSVTQKRGFKATGLLYLLEVCYKHTSRFVIRWSYSIYMCTAISLLVCDSLRRFKEITKIFAL